MIQTSDNYRYDGPKPNFARDYYEKLADLKRVTPNDIDDGHIAYCAENKTHYVFFSSNSSDSTLGYWREYKPIDLSLNPESENAVANKVVATQVKDLSDKFEELKEKVDTLTWDGELNSTSTSGVQNKVITAKFNAIGVQITDLFKATEDLVKKSEVLGTIDKDSTLPVQSKAISVKVTNIKTQLDNLLKRINKVEPIDENLKDSTFPVQNKAVTLALEDIESDINDLYYKVQGLNYSAAQNYCVSGWSKTDKMNPKAIEQWGNPDILRDWQFYLVDHDKLSPDKTAVAPVCKLKKNNILRKANGEFAKTIFTNVFCKGQYEDEEGNTKSAFSTPGNNIAIVSDDVEFDPSTPSGVSTEGLVSVFVVPELWTVEDRELLYSLVETTYVRSKEKGLGVALALTRNTITGETINKLLREPLYPWEEYQLPDKDFEVNLSVMLGMPYKVYLLDQVEGKSGKIWKGIFKKACIWDGIDVSKYPLEVTGMGPTPATSATGGAKQKMFTRFVDYFRYATNGTGLNMHTNCMGHLGEGNLSRCFMSEDHTIDGVGYKRFIYGRSNDVSQLTNCTYARNNNPDPQKPYPFAEGGYHSRNAFVSAMEALYQTKYLNETSFFASGISANDAVSNEAQWNAYGGIRWRVKDTTTWSYGTWNTTPGNIYYNTSGSRTHFNALLAYWFPKEQVLESQTAISFAVEMGIGPGQEFEFCGSTFWYKNVPGAMTVKEGEMNCILFKKIPYVLEAYNSSKVKTEFELEIILRMSLMNGYNHSGDYWIYYGGGYEQVGTVTNPPGASVATGHPVEIYTCFDQKKWRSTSELQTVTLNNLGTFVFESDPNYWKVWEGENLADSYTLVRPSYTAYKSEAGGSLGTGECFWSYTSKNWSSTLGQRVRIGAANRGGWSGDLSRYIGNRVTGSALQGGGYYSAWVGGSLQCLMWLGELEE